MTAASTLLAGRRMAEKQMVDECTIKRKTGRTTDPDSGVVVDTYAAPIYSGRCAVKVRDVDAANPEAGPAELTALRMRVDVPITVVGVRVGDVVTVTAVDPTTGDLDLVDRQFRVVAPFHGTLKTARRLPVEEIAS